MRKTVLLFFVILVFASCKHQNNEIPKDCTDSNTILEKCLYENENKAFINSGSIADIVTNNYYHYGIFWTQRIVNEPIITEDLMNNNRNMDFQEGPISDIQELYIYVNLMKQNEYEGNSTYQSKIVTYIKSRYNEEEKLFFDQDGESIIATYHALNTLKEAGVDIDAEYPDIRSMLEEAFESGNILSLNEDEFVDNLVTVGAPYINTYLLFDDVVVTDQIINWYNYWSREVIETRCTVEHREFFVHVYYDLLCIGKEIGLPLVPSDEFSALLNDRYIQEMYFSDSQLTYKALQLVNLVDNDRYNDNLYFIENNRTYWIYDNQPIFQVSELYYGILLYDNHSLEYPQKKVNNYVLDRITNASIRELFFINEVLDKHSVQSEKLENMVHSINAAGLIDNKEYEELFYYYKLCESIGLNPQFGCNVTDEEITGCENDRSLYYMLMVSKLNNNLYDPSFILNQILKFQANEGGFVYSKESGITNIYSTYRMLSLIKEFNLGVNEVFVEKHISFIDNLMTGFGGYFIKNTKDVDLYSNVSANYSLRSYYEGEACKAILDTMMSDISKGR